jgi:hypothetical protein
MTWTKLGDEYPDHCWRLSDAAYRLHNEALIWSNRRHLDGRLDKAEMHLWAKRPEAAPELVDQGFWYDCGDYFQIHYHLGWQRTAEEWLRQSTVNAANGRKGGRPRKHPKSETVSDSVSDTESEPESDSVSEKRTGKRTEKRTESEMDWTGQDGPRREQSDQGSARAQKPPTTDTHDTYTFDGEAKREFNDDTWRMYDQ